MLDAALWLTVTAADAASAVCVPVCAAVLQHRNTMNEFMGLIKGMYEAKQSGFLPGT
jgi:hypothetical protein